MIFMRLEPSANILNQKAKEPIVLGSEQQIKSSLPVFRTLTKVIFFLC
jgi:hypothetical protein